jgi:uncharacterized membrane protein
MTFMTDTSQSLASASARRRLRATGGLRVLMHLRSSDAPRADPSAVIPAARNVPWSGRVRSLDGLRGVAALIVVVHHALLTSPTLARVNYGAVPGSVHGFLWWMTYTPLHLIWAGPEAVFVFFVLSGFVLFLRPRRRGSVGLPTTPGGSSAFICR